MTHRQFRLPDLGEGLTEAEIVRWLTKVGDEVSVNQPLVEVETAKAVVEIPSPFAGRLIEAHGEPGASMAVGSPLVTIDVVSDEAGAGHDPVEPSGTEPSGTESSGADRSRVVQVEHMLPASRSGERDPGERTQVLVGYGPRTNERPRRRGRRHRPSEVPPAEGGDLGRGGPERGHPERGDARGRALAKPPVRKLARDLGVDLTTIIGTGPGGSISRDDVQAAVRTLPGRASLTAPPASAPAVPPRPAISPHPAEAPEPPGGPGAPPAPAGRPRPGAIPDGARFDPATRTWRVPVGGVRRSMARAMVGSLFTAPHVTEFLSVDVTEMMRTRERIAALPEFAGVRVTPLLLVAKALLTAVHRHPLINSRWVEGGTDTPTEIVMPQQVNLGIAVAGPRGLVVPNIPDAGGLDLAGLARGLQTLAEAARADRLRPENLRGGTITITNIGVFGVDIGTPILNPGEAAILAVGAIKPAPWVRDGELAVRTVAQLALSFDHRIVDGELGSAVLADVGAILTDPTLAIAWS